MNYQFGTNESSVEDLPVKISKERFEQKLLALLDKAGQRALKIGYAEEKDGGYTFGTTKRCRVFS
ncbi:hypothetical protein [Paenibacillus sp. 1A_MP2]|uniref:hypothetical protein n=1 Tax=Paenibacillus sp. 1A_MP2 TaxID=3457495 RepID=UPI003FCD3B27